MTINYKKFMKHAEIMIKGAKHLGSRPILQGVWHNEEGNKIGVTDSHYAYFAKNVNAPKNIVTHAVTGEQVEGSYPELERLFPSVDDRKQAIIIESVERLIEVIQAMQYAVTKGMKRRDVQLKLENNKLSVEQLSHDDNKGDIDFSFNLGNSVNIEESTYVSSQYLLNTLEMFKDQGYESLQIAWYGSLRPFLIIPTTNDNLQAIITPIRRH